MQSSSLFSARIQQKRKLALTKVQWRDSNLKIELLDAIPFKAMLWDYAKLEGIATTALKKCGFYGAYGDTLSDQGDNIMLKVPDWGHLNVGDSSRVCVHG